MKKQHMKKTLNFNLYSVTAERVSMKYIIYNTLQKVLHLFELKTFSIIFSIHHEQFEYVPLGYIYF